MGVGFQVPIKNLVSILISTAVKTARVVSLSGLKTLSFPLTGYSYELAAQIIGLAYDVMELITHPAQASHKLRIVPECIC